MRKSYNDTPETLLEAILTMQDKILALKDEFEMAPLTFEAEMGDGRTITRANPFVQEYRALVKDYSVALKSYKELSGNDDISEGDEIAKLRERFKVAV